MKECDISLQIENGGLALGSAYILQGVRLASLAYSLIVNCLIVSIGYIIVVVGGRVHEWCKKGSGIL